MTLLFANEIIYFVSLVHVFACEGRGGGFVDIGKWLGGMGRYLDIVMWAAGSAFGLWALLYVMNGVLSYFGVRIAPVAMGLAVGTDFWATFGLFVALAMVVNVLRYGWSRAADNS